MKPHLFLIHGWNMHSGIWGPLKDCLAARFELTVAELPGYDSCGQPNATTLTGEQQELPISELTRQMLDSIDEQAPPRALWCGWSLGATLAMAAACRPEAGPNQMEGLILLAPTPRFLKSNDWEFGMPSSSFDRLTRITLKRYSTGLNAFLKLQLAGTDGESMMTQLERLLAGKRPSDQALMEGQRILCELDLREKLAAIRLPTLVVAASQDDVVPPSASRWVSDQIEDSDWAELGEGHAFPITDAPELARLISNRFSPNAGPAEGGHGI